MTSLQLSMLLNIGSIIIGLGAWALAFLALSAKRTITSRRFSLTSFSCCAISLILQFCEIANRANRGDYAAIEDTIRAIIIAAIILVVITVILNIAALNKTKEVSL